MVGLHQQTFSVGPLKCHSGPMCLRWGVCVAVGPCCGGISGLLWERCGLQGTGLGALPHLCLSSSWEENPSGPLLRAGLELVRQMHLGCITWGGQAGGPQGGSPDIPVHLPACVIISVCAWGQIHGLSFSLGAGGAVGSAPAQGLLPGDTGHQCVTEAVTPCVPWVNGG